MARTLTRNSQAYAPGTFGPFSIDSFTSANTDKIEVVMTNVNNWPVVAGGPPLFTLTIKWNTGEGGIFREFAVLHTEKDGTTPQTQVTYGSMVPRRATGKAVVSSGTVSIESFRAFTTGITFRAV